jgi:hypothetical protein
MSARPNPAEPLWTAWQSDVTQSLWPAGYWVHSETTEGPGGAIATSADLWSL